MKRHTKINLCFSALTQNRLSLRSCQKIDSPFLQTVSAVVKFPQA